MYAPRPFAIDYPFQTHALAAIGAIAIATKRIHNGADRRRLRSTGDFLSVKYTGG
jgi:hypothetical protein